MGEKKILYEQFEALNQAWSEFVHSVFDPIVFPIVIFFNRFFKDEEDEAQD